jgi:hypothetical protein
MRLAGSDEIFSALAGRFAANRATPADDVLDAFFQAYALLKSKGYSDNAAEQVASDIAQGREPAPHVTKRFADIYGDPS